MKYVRNYRNKQTAPKVLPGTNEITNEIATRLQSDIEWIENLSNTDQFSKEWVHTVALELLMQCMGKKDIVMGFKGEEKIVRVFKEKAALKTLEMIAKMNEHLFDVVKGQVTKTINETIEHKQTIEIQPNRNRTIEVLDILQSCGAIQPSVKQLNHSEMEQVYPA